MNKKRPWVVAGVAAVAIAGLGVGMATAGDAGDPDVPAQVELTDVDQDSANSPADSANSPADSANSPADSANSPADSANSPANSANSPAGR